MAVVATVAVVPVARADGALQEVSVRLGVVSVVTLVAALVLGWSPLVPAAIALTGGTYGAQLAVDDAPLDGAAPALAAGLLVAAELAYWSLEEREGTPGDAGDGLRHVPVVALLGIGALLAGGLLLALVDLVRTKSLALDVVGAAAAAAILVAVVLAGRAGRRGDG